MNQNKKVKIEVNKRKVLDRLKKIPDFYTEILGMLIFVDPISF